MSDYAQMDAALDWLAPFGPDLANGFTNHAPMVSEALSAVGRSDAILPWLESERPNFLARERTEQTIPGANWTAMLGNGDAAAWREFFAQRLLRAPWEDVVRQSVPVLIPGLMAAAAHGAIRTGHAVRALSNARTPQRVAELGEALGYWAAHFETLPQARFDGARRMPRDAIAQVPLLPEAMRAPRGSFTSGLRQLKDFAAFAPVIDMIDVSDANATLSDLSETFTRVLLANATDSYTAIAFVHGVTGTAALRWMAPYLDGDAVREGLRHAWQTACALYAVYGTARPDATDAHDGARPEELIDAAIANRDDHAIKFVGAALGAYSLSPNPVYLAAARRVLSLLP